MIAQKMGRDVPAERLYVDSKQRKGRPLIFDI
jgi:hypothetical protein